MNRQRALAITIVAAGLLLAPAARAGEAVDVAADAALEARVQSIASELRCLVCQNQSLADSHADLAVQLKSQVREQLRAGRSEVQILAWMSDRYGDFILYRPRWRLATVLLWLGPVLLLTIGLGVLLRGLRRPRVQPALSGVDAVRAATLLGDTAPLRRIERSGD
jgi:cytochrome c-type biogenesis protein CcmH